MKSEWFREWFNTEEYLCVYQHRNEADAEQHIKLILDNTELKSGAKILDMACGAGRHSILLGSRGFDVTAVDLSENLLKIAQQRAAEEELEVNFIHSDIRKFCPVEKFDLVLNLFTSFGYFETDDENFMILEKAYDFLTESGCFVLDYFNSEFLTRNLTESSSERLDNGEILQRRQIVDKRVIKKITIKRGGVQHEFEESVRMYTQRELVSVLTKIGFEVAKSFGDFFAGDFDSEKSPRVILFCRK